MSLPVEPAPTASNPSTPLSPKKSDPATPRPEEKMSAKPRLVAGLDWSVTSPAAAAQLYSSDGKLLRMWAMCFQQRRATEIPTESKLSETFTLTEFPMYAATRDKSRWGVAEHHTWMFVQWMRDVNNAVMRMAPECCACHFFIEDYAYGVRKTNSFTKLAEDAGLIMYYVFANWNHETRPVSISAVKKYWTGKGTATKADMYQSYKTRGYPDLLEPLRCPHPDANPVSDVVDAIAVTTFGYGSI